MPKRKRKVPNWRVPDELWERVEPLLPRYRKSKAGGRNVDPSLRELHDRLGNFVLKAIGDAALEIEMRPTNRKTPEEDRATGDR